MSSDGFARPRPLSPVEEKRAAGGYIVAVVRVILSQCRFELSQTTCSRSGGRVLN